MNQTNTQKSTSKLAKMGILIAISIVLAALIHPPIFPALPFLEYDPADIPILIGTFSFGPVGGLIMAVVAAVIQGVTVSAASGIYGIIMHILATGTLVLVAGLIYRKFKTRKGAVVALVCGTLAMTAIMVPANLFITPYFMGAPREAIIDILPFIIAFNLIKAGANSIVAFILYKRLSPFLHR